MEQFGYFGVAFLIMIENLFPPIPSEVILTFGGFMTTTTDLNIPLMIVAATIGAVVGAAILYGVGTLLDVERLDKLSTSTATSCASRMRISTKRIRGSIATVFGQYSFAASYR